MLNQIILIGRLTKDPERRGQNSEKPVAVIRLAVDRDFKRKGDGDPDVDFFSCTVFGNQAKFVLEFGRKGRLVSLVGRMQQHEWTDQQTGEKRTTYEVIGSDIKFLDPKPENAGTSAVQSTPATPQNVNPVVAAPVPTMAPPAPQVQPPVIQPAMSGYPQPVPGAAEQYPTSNFSGVPDGYAWGPGGTPIDNPPF